MQAMEISRTGLDVEWRRMEVIAQNLANAGTVGTQWQPLRVLSGPKGGFRAAVNETSGPASDLRGVEVKDIGVQGLPPRLVYEPGHPAADARGYVAYPGLDHAAEMTLLVKSSRIYEANVVALNLARQMYARALDLGQRA
jgi:flagellar basal-body rod protein FlgC